MDLAAARFRRNARDRLALRAISIRDAVATNTTDDDSPTVPWNGEIRPSVVVVNRSAIPPPRRPVPTRAARPPKRRGCRSRPMGAIRAPCPRLRPARRRCRPRRMARRRACALGRRPPGWARNTRRPISRPRRRFRSARRGPPALSRSNRQVRSVRNHDLISTRPTSRPPINLLVRGS